MQKNFDVDGPVQLDVRLASGEITIDATLEGRAEVELIAHDEDSQQLVDEATVELRGRELLVDVPNRRGGFSLGGLFGGRGITCRVRCPQGSSLRSRTKSADLDVRGVLADVDAATASGDGELGDLTGDLSYKSASGDIAAGSVGGRASVNTASGDVSLARVVGALAVNTASGDIGVESAESDAKANTASGDVALAATMRGRVQVNSASGDVHVGVRRGARAYLDCSTVSGDTSSELDMTGSEPSGGGPLVEIRVRTVSGDIRITRAPAPADTQEVHA